MAGALPLAWLVIMALRDVAMLGDGLLSSRTATLLWNTVLLGILVAVLTGAAGTALAVLLMKTDLPGRRILFALLSFPFFLPPYVLALGWFTVLGRHGLLAAVLGPRAGMVTSEAFFGLIGAVLVLTVAYTPIALHLAAIGLRSIDPAVEEAARTRFRWPRIIQRIDLPLISPPVALAMLLTFVLVVGEFGVPAYLRYPVFSGAVFTQFAAFLNIQAAVVTSLPLALLVVVGLAVERYWLRQQVGFLARARTTPLIAPLGRWRKVSAGGAWSYAVLTVVLPLGGLVLQAGGVASYAAAVRDAASSIIESVWTAGCAATVMLVVGLMLAYLVERSGRTRRNALDSGLLLLFAAPGTVLGVSLILLWNRPGLTGVYASVFILLIGYVAHYVPVAARVTGVGLQALSPGIEEAARIAGVPWTRMLRRVLAPMLAPALVGAWFLAFVFCLRDLDLVMTVHPPGVETLPVRVYTLMANSPGSVTAELGVVMVMLAVAVLLVAGATLAITRRISAWS